MRETPINRDSERATHEIIRVNAAIVSPSGASSGIVFAIPIDTEPGRASADRPGQKRAPHACRYTGVRMVNPRAFVEAGRIVGHGEIGARAPIDPALTTMTSSPDEVRGRQSIGARS
jgi:hypothetical protein